MNPSSAVISDEDLKFLRLEMYFKLESLTLKEKPHLTDQEFEFLMKLCEPYTTYTSKNDNNNS